MLYQVVPSMQRIRLFPLLLIPKMLLLYVHKKLPFWELTEDEIDAYVASKEPLDKAGSYGIQGKGSIFVQHIQGDYYSVVGLPIARLVRELKQFGSDVTHA